MELSERLEAICALLPPCRCLADIGTDHGFVPIEAVRRGKAERALALDVVPGPLKRAEEHILRSGLGSLIAARLGDGLRPLKEGEADCVLIAGMGGRLILRILSERPELTGRVPYLVLSPHTDVPEVRRGLGALGRRIEDERMIFGDGKYYVVLRTVPGSAELTRDEELFGPVLLRERPEVFRRWLRHEEEKTEALLSALRRADSVRAREIIPEKEKYLERVREMLSRDGGI